MTKKQISGLCTLAMLILTIAAANAVANAQTFSPLYSDFNSSSGPFGFSYPALLAQGQDGNIYTTSTSGGTPVEGIGASGTFFSMGPAPGAPLSVFTFYYTGVPNNTGCTPYSGVTMGTDGNFYGAANGCSLGSLAPVFQMTPNGDGTWGENVAYDFTGGSDGSYSMNAPIEGTDGNFYGTSFGVAGNCGVIYQLTPGPVLNTLHTFDGTDGCDPYAPLVQGTDGNLYGTTEIGGTGSGNGGVVFKFTLPAGPYEVLYNFDTTHGSQPISQLVQGTDGNLYGTTVAGGQYRGGVVFRFTISSGKLKVLYNFDPPNDGYQPFAGLVQATDSNLYGVTQAGGAGWGTIYKIATSGKGYTPLYSFDGTTAAFPGITLLQHTNGLLYGLANAGGTYDCGTFYSFNVNLIPFVSLVSTSGAVGSTVGILGQGFTGTKKVTFTGGSATFSVVSDTYLTATVPTGAKLGFVTVKTRTGTLKSNKKFRVTP